MCVCVRVCVCVCERGRERECVCERERERERVCATVHACVCVFVCESPSWESYFSTLHYERTPSQTNASRPTYFPACPVHREPQIRKASVNVITRVFRLRHVQILNISV